MDEFILVHQTRMRKSQLFTVNMRQQVQCGTNQGFNNGSEPWNKCFSSGACAIVKGEGHSRNRIFFVITNKKFI